MTGSPRKDGNGDQSREPKPDDRKNVSPDAVKDPNEKTEGHPGLPAGSKGGDDADPGAG
ncbi:hypothetical protein [Methylobacterium gnaphalii]|uniref:Uncharacterized protein n=1 Tax=Methylobacterium gnaphalii TaxID=1010610 RepID=A0A512JM47_9HYPH|nr:hypothetical protein [Methylobacterium gnaphalii]GEP11037.1 hypothetical protein MGN01_28820 [Methylobacterium gnaphalii]GJD69623.1 hypothetical protein MMMDOFMJ_2560 [Methylobacterium gnaphalii]GLS50315.1 hypothetical protein GCM10007885_31670 [Methylobacterium gnaphalii]